MISVQEARKRILTALPTMPTETVHLAEAMDRVLSNEVKARVTQPPFGVSSMDGYAVRSKDTIKVPIELNIVAEVAAGSMYAEALGPKEAVRIFTGSRIPSGADTVIIQENVKTKGNAITIKNTAKIGENIRPKGLDFFEGETGIAANKLLTARDIGLAAAMNIPWLQVYRRPRVALLATGNEIVRPGERIGPNQIVSSNSLAIAGLIKKSGGETIDLGIAKDNQNSIQEMTKHIKGADLLITMGGASVGDHDLIRQSLKVEGLKLDFWRVAMRPGKPLIFGMLNNIPVIGLPGNPVSSLVCGLVYVRPAVRQMMNINESLEMDFETVKIGSPLNKNDNREDYIRAQLKRSKTGSLVAIPFTPQDSSMLSQLARADCLIVRKPLADKIETGADINILRLDNA